MSRSAETTYSDYADEDSTHRDWSSFAVRILGGLGSFVSIFIALWGNQMRYEDSYRFDIGDTLGTSVLTTVSETQEWFALQRATVTGWSTTPALLQSALPALEKDKPHRFIEASSTLTRLMMPVLLQAGYQSYGVMDRNGVILLSDQYRDLGEPSGMPPSRLSQILAGETIVELPRNKQTRIQQGFARGSIRNPENMRTTGPIYNDMGEIVGALSLSINPEQSLQLALHRNQQKRSGKIFVFDKEGLPINGQGLAETEVLSSRGNRYQPPGPETTRGQENFWIKPYRNDYGVPMIGAGQWIPDINVGIATEIEMTEAFAPVYVERYRTYMLLGLVLLTYGAAMVFILWTQYTKKQRRLDHKIKNRTLDTVKTLPVPVLLFDKKEKLAGFNGASRELFATIPGFLRQGRSLHELGIEAIEEGALIPFADTKERFHSEAEESSMHSLFRNAFREPGKILHFESRTGEHYTLASTVLAGGYQSLLFLNARDPGKTGYHAESLNREQQQRIDRRTLQLQTTREELRVVKKALFDTQEHLVQNEKMASLGGMVAGITHEVNTPIGVCMTAASHFSSSLAVIRELFETGKMERADFEKFEKMASETINLVERNLMRASDLIGSFQSIAVNQSQEEVHRFEIGAYVHEVLGTLKPMMKKGGHTLEPDIAVSRFVTTFPGAIAQLITNLLSNALTHGLRDQRNGIIHIRLYAGKANTIQLTVEDNGSGVPAEHADRLFDPFFTTNRNKGSTGLGLSIVSHLVTEKLRGEIRYTPSEEGGARFDVVIPDDVSRLPQGKATSLILPLA